MKRLLIALLPLALAACSGSPEPTASESASVASTAAVAPAPMPVPSAPMDSDLPRYHWQLVQATGADGKRLDGLFEEGKPPLQLDFKDGRLNVSHACNVLSGAYQLTDEKLQVPHLLHTMRACVDRVLMQRETTISAVLTGQPGLELATVDGQPSITLAGTDGTRLTFAGVPTPETRYGGPGETVFLEVAAEEVPCNHPLMPDTQCLNVRERHYDAQGLRVGEPGEWHAMSSPIQGYEHQPGTRNVLRVKRFHVANPPADAPDTAYVLDMVVESELAKPSR